MNCETFKGGYCKKINTHVPRSWCVDRCNFGKNLIKPAKPKGPTKTQMVLHFAKAMTKWVSKGLPIVSKEVYIERRTICASCHDGSNCPICGCKLWAKTALETEKCPEGKW